MNRVESVSHDEGRRGGHQGYSRSLTTATSSSRMEQRWHGNSVRDDNGDRGVVKLAPVPITSVSRGGSSRFLARRCARPRTRDRS